MRFESKVLTTFEVDASCPRCGAPAPASLPQRVDCVDLEHSLLHFSVNCQECGRRFHFTALADTSWEQPTRCH